MSIEGAYQYGGEVRTAGYMPVIGGKRPESTPLSFKDSLTDVAQSQAAENAGSGAEENGFLSFLFGILDVINPLQHIPVVSTIYRHLTGDEISPMARIAGDTLYGGPVGAAVAVANVALEKSTGKDMGETVIAMVTDDKPAAVEVAAAEIPALDVKDIIWNDAPTMFAQKKTEPLSLEPSLELDLTAEKQAPKELIAFKMMEALDKYGAMKKSGI